MHIPLLIGGATTSRMHTAVKIAENYNQGVLHVLDASRSVTVVSDLLNENKEELLQKTNEEYEQLRSDFLNRKTHKNYLPIAEARKRKLKMAWENYTPVEPKLIGNKTFHQYSLQEIADYIDWNPFFITWEMHGKFPAILEDEIIGVEASKLFHDAKTLLQQVIAENWLQAEAVFGIWQTTPIQEDSVILKDQSTKLHFLRQQIQKADSQANLCLSDFISPITEDYIGAFAVTIKGIEPHLKKFDAAHDDYNKIMLQALADRLAEAFTECVHKK